MSQVDDNAVSTYLKKHLVVKSWIEEVLQVKLGDDLLAALKNGIVLCYLMVEIEPRAIPSIQEATTAEFRLKENVSFFLDACEELGMAKYERFQPNELWGPFLNPVRVVECLFCLAKIAAQRDFSPAINVDSVPDSKVVMPTGKALQDIKTMLAHLGGSRAGRGQKVSAELMRRKLAYLVGHDVDFSQYEAGYIKFQALYRGFAARLKYKKMIRALAYRERVAKEILTTERDYVKNLGLLIQVYYIPLGDLASSKKPILTKDQIKGIFSDVQTIFTFNESLLQRLEERVGSWSQHQKLGDIFVDIVAFLKVYTNYVQNFNTSLSTLSSVGKKAAVAKFLRECIEDPRCKSLDLSAFLIMPVQRIPRYHLLLQDLVKHTWVDHCDYENLHEAMEKVKQVATLLNDKKREAETLAETFARHSWIKGKELDVTPDRRFIREDSFTDVKKSSEVTIFLFNDIIVYGKPAGSIEPGKTKIKFKGQLSTIDCEVSERPPVKSHKFCFSLGDIIYSAKTEEERAEYIEAVKEVKELATMKLSSHLRARMDNVAKKGTLKRVHAVQARAETRTEDTAVDAASAEDVLRLRKKNQRSPTLSRSTSLVVRTSTSPTLTTLPAQATQVTQAPQTQKSTPAARLSDDSTGRTSTGSNGSLNSDVSDGEAEREALMKSKNELLQRLLGLPTDPKKDTKKSKKQRVTLEQDLESILRRLSEIDQHTNSPPIVAEKESSPGASPPPSPPSGSPPATLSSRSSPSTISRKPQAQVSREEARRNFASTSVAVPLSAVTRDNRAFNSVRGFQPNTQPSPPGMFRAASSPIINGTPYASPSASPSPSPPTKSIKPTLLPKLDGNAKPHNSNSNSSSPANSPPPSPGPSHLRPVPSASIPALTPIPARPTSPTTTRPKSPSPTSTPPRPKSPSPTSSPTSSRPPSPSSAASPPLTPTLTPTPSLPSRPTSPILSPNSSPTNNNSGIPKSPSNGNLTFDEVQQKKVTLEMTRLETYLSEAEFLRIFKQSREAFYKQPKWKQEQLKKDNKLI